MHPDHTFLKSRLAARDGLALALYLTTHSGLPGARANLALIEAFAAVVGEIVREPNPPADFLEALLDGWAAEPARANDPREILPAAAVRAYGQVAAVRPEWWGDEVARLHRAASSSRWRTREMVATGVQAMFDADWARTYAAMIQWARSADPLVIRAAAAAIAEPRLLKTPERAQAALVLQANAVDRFLRIPADARRTEDARTLRQALGYTLSVVAAEAPNGGFALLGQIALLKDSDAHWIVRENVAKKRLERWPEHCQELRIKLS